MIDFIFPPFKSSLPSHLSFILAILSIITLCYSEALEPHISCYICCHIWNSAENFLRVLSFGLKFLIFSGRASIEMKVEPLCYSSLLSRAVAFLQYARKQELNIANRIFSQLGPVSTTFTLKGVRTSRTYFLNHLDFHVTCLLFQVVTKDMWSLSLMCI